MSQGLQKPEVEETEAHLRRKPKDPPKRILLLVNRIFGEEATFGTVYRHHHHPFGRELFTGEQGEREDRGDDADRRARLKVPVPTFVSGPYHSCDHGPKEGPSEEGVTSEARSPKRPSCDGRSCCKLAMDFPDGLMLGIDVLPYVLYLTYHEYAKKIYFFKI